MEKIKNKYKVIILLLVICVISIGYAILTSSLSINGLFTFSNNRWNVYLDNVILDNNSTILIAPSISEDKKSMTFSLNLKKPGDFYTFYVDAVNNSTLDAMINSVEINGIEESTKNYLDYSITYFNGSEVNVGDKLLAGAVSNFKISFLFKEITLEQLPTEDINLNITITINYKQDDGSAILAAYSNSWNFNYTGKEETFTIPLSGTYRLETWGGQGRSNDYDLVNHPDLIGGFGGYSTGEVAALKDQQYFITIGNPGRISAVSVGGGGVSQLGGGGATHIATVSGVLSTLESQKDSILIVSGGGGGNDTCNGYNISAGGYKGMPGLNATGGTQTSGGISSTSAYNGSFGLGGNSYISEYKDTGGAGGGGFYGGAGSSYSAGCGGGGSSYIANPLLTNKVMYCYKCEESSEASTKTISTTNVSNNPISQFAKKGNGYARITYVGD